MTDRDIMQQALEALEYARGRLGVNEYKCRQILMGQITALRERLERPVQQPVQQPRKPLTDEMDRQAAQIMDYSQRNLFIIGWLHAEAAHGIKEKA